MSVRNNRDYYDLLNVDRRSTTTEIKNAHSHLVRKFHPHNGSYPNATKFQAINEAFRVLSDPSKRQVYDSMGKEGYDDVMRQGGDALLRQVGRKPHKIDSAAYLSGGQKTGTLVDESLYNDGGDSGLFEDFRYAEGYDSDEFIDDKTTYYESEESSSEEEDRRPRKTKKDSSKKRSKSPSRKRGGYEENNESERGRFGHISEIGDISGSSMFEGERIVPEGPGFEKKSFYCGVKVYAVTPTGKKLSNKVLKTEIKPHNREGRKTAPPPDLYVSFDISGDELFCAKESIKRNFEINVEYNCTKCKGTGEGDRSQIKIEISEEEKAKHSKCARCHGSGESKSNTCLVCKGSGINLVKAKMSSSFRMPSSSSKDIKCNGCGGTGMTTSRTIVRTMELSPSILHKEIVCVENFVGVTSYESYPHRGPVHFQANVSSMKEPFHRDHINTQACWCLIELASNWVHKNLAIPLELPVYKVNSNEEEDDSVSNKIVLYSADHTIRHMDVAKINNIGFGGSGTLFVLFSVLTTESEKNLLNISNLPQESSGAHKKLCSLSSAEREKYGDIQSFGVPSSSYRYPYFKKVENVDRGTSNEKPTSVPNQSRTNSQQK